MPDGAAVKAGDVLVKLDSRQVEAQIRQAQATLAKDRATLEQAERDVVRFNELVARQTGTQVSLDNAKTAASAARAAIMGDEAQIENLNVQLSWYTIKAPITGRVGTFSQKAGNIIRSGDATAMALTRPARIIGSDEAIESNISGSWPATTSCSASAEPR